MSRALLFSLLSAAALVSACAPALGPPPPTHTALPPGSAGFSPEAFAWSKGPGRNTIAGRVAYRQGATRYTCAGSNVVLTPETAWSRERMGVLYGSTERAALPTEQVRARTASAPAGDVAPFVRRTTCDDADQFAFGSVPDGAWYAITIVKPVGAPKGESVALMRRIVVRGGRTFTLGL